MPNRKDKICLDKKTLLLISVLVCLLAGFVWVTNYLLGRSYSTKSRAAAPNPRQQIVGGRQAAPDEFPFIVYMNKNGQNWCGGTLINKSWILTAAHCSIGIKPYAITAAVNSVNRKIDDSNRIRVTDIIINPKFPKQGAFNDLALMKLEKEVFVESPLLPENDDYYVKGNDLILVGYGCTGLSPTPGATPDPVVMNYVKDFPDKLQVITLPLDRPVNGNPDNHEFLFGYDDNRSLSQTACFGDSGSPLLYTVDGKTYILGIQSKSWSSIFPVPSVAAKVSFFTPWIKSTMAQYDGNLEFCKSQDWSSFKCSGTLKYGDFVMNGNNRYLCGCSGNFRYPTMLEVSPVDNEAKNMK